VDEQPSMKLVNRWREGDQQAANELFQRYANQLIGLAHRRLSAQLATRIDAQDVIQSVYCSFFVGARNGRFVLQQSGDLWRLLVAITLHKLRRQVERHTADKRAMAAERPMPNPDSLFGISYQALAREPSPEEAVALTDTLEEIMGSLDAVQRHMIELRLQGYSVGEIVLETQRSATTVRRVLDRFKQRLGDQYLEGGACD
jgi:RNA polymerase sigma-70 factor (ECF subfamily)